MNLVERIKAILQNPKSEWLAIEGEQHGAGYLIFNYAAIVGAIPPAAAFIGFCVTGYTGYRLNFLLGLSWALTVYALTLFSVVGWPTSSTGSPACLVVGAVLTTP